MDIQEREETLLRAKSFFRESIAEKHSMNTAKCSKLKEFNVNPFTIHYIASFAFGDDTPESLAKALIYPRVLGTSIATSFGNNLQRFCHEVLPGYASTTSGMDIEFIDTIDGRKKYCQLKAGPNTINKDDVPMIEDHFKRLANLARTNQLSNFNPITDACVGVMYGTHSQLSANYKKLEKDYPVFVGQDFWTRLTGDKDFYADLINVFTGCAEDYNDTNLLDETIKLLAEDIIKHPEILLSSASIKEYGSVNLR